MTQASKRALTTAVTLATLLVLALCVGMPAQRVTLRVPSFGFVYPIMTPRISSNYGMRIHPIRGFSAHHNGIDLAAPKDSVIRAALKGVIVFAGNYRGYGNVIVIEHANNMTTHYAHCESFKVRPGQRVKAGQIIALVGSTGLSTGPHLHFEVRFNGKPVDPETVFPGLAEEAKG